MVCTPAPAILKAMRSAPVCVLASIIAWRSVPAPESPVVVTMKVDGSTQSSRCSNVGRKRFVRRECRRRRDEPPNMTGISFVARYAHRSGIDNRGDYLRGAPHMAAIKRSPIVLARSWDVKMTLGEG